MRRRMLLVFSLTLIMAGVAASQETIPKLEVLKTPGGTRLGVLGPKPAAPAPTLLVFATDLENTLPVPAYSQIGHLLMKEGWLVAGVDLPCHGPQQRAGEPGGLDGWRFRADKGEDVVADLTKRAREALDFLIKEGYTDPNRVAAAGTSRGGFMALHFTASEPRVKAVVAFAPVTYLPALTEFKGTENREDVLRLTLLNAAPKLAGRSVWMTIGNNDSRVGTDHCIALARKLGTASEHPTPNTQHPVPDVELRLMPTLGHRTYPQAHPDAAAWLSARIRKN
jgi:dienelactone hydrolase